MREAKVRQNGAAIRAIRQREGLSISALANQIQVTDPHLRNIENEHKSASTAHLAAIAKVLNVPLAALRRSDDDEVRDEHVNIHER
ncbi:MAG: helix-turn-helix transcriptional regulator [Candidatus Nanopelagicales bacterium]|jgi:transcriptional regulator with XRE-family HTH domain